MTSICRILDIDPKNPDVKVIGIILSFQSLFYILYHQNIVHIFISLVSNFTFSLTGHVRASLIKDSICQ